MSNPSRYCCVVDCTSKSPNCGQDKRTIFKVPNEAKRREKWLQVLSPYLRQGKQCRKQLYVCDLHFKPDDILRNMILLYADGSMEEIPRESVRLKSTSVPSIFNNIQGIPEDGGEEFANMQDPVSFNASSSSLLVDASLLSIHETLPPDSSEIAMHHNQEIFHGEASVLQDQEISQPEVAVQQECQEMQYNLNALESDVTTYNFFVNITNWIFAKMPGGICFFYVGDNFPNPTRSVFIGEDMTVQIRAEGRVVQMHVLDRVLCLQDLLGIIETINGLTLCRGAGNSSPCPFGFIPCNSKQENERCDVCRIEIHRKKDRELRRIKRAITKKISTQRLVKYLQRKYKRLQNNYVIARNDIEKLKLRCSEG